MKIIIQKFGGTSVSTEERRNQVVAKVKKAIKEGYSPVVVVSAIGRAGDPYATDTLLSLIDDNYKKGNLQGTDMLMCCGEIISTVIMSNALINAGINATPLTGGQAGIITDDKFTEANVTYVNTHNLRELIKEGIVPVVAGFQGITEKGYFTTLGRGGSDTSACILGAYLKAEGIEIYTDVDGMMTADPRIVEKANLIQNISYEEVFQLANQGAKVIHPKAVNFAKESNIPIYIKNTMKDSEGTLINNKIFSTNDKHITGITHLKDRVQITVKLNENNNRNYRTLLDKIAQKNISLDLINIFPTEQIFTIDLKEKLILEDLLRELNIKYEVKDNCCKIAIVGIGMIGVPGIMAKIINTLRKENIEILQTADSNMTIWILIDNRNLEKALNLLHEVFLFNE
ncbi:aspartate kinase [Caproiciproducens sp. MSJ-32]|uniref:aspartate kinase n=1 Tax=Caproiciproducens sp. MSJ-32 TaxID=2841527 RepID=UPI001C0F6CD6|nr:aspartate kinase [Caproiciproducens sp. MSJ-32]MBU5455795.1 aspartate kinase [Caproiciproducens sp. MSJ-32]